MTIDIKSVDIGFVIAMKEEAEAVASALNLRSASNIHTFKSFKNRDGSVLIITPGVDKHYLCFGSPISRTGKVPITVVTSYMIEKCKPKCLLNCGTAGGIESSGLKIGDIVLATGVTNHDIQSPMSGYKEFAERVIKMRHNKLLARLKHPYKKGIVSSGESFAMSSVEWKRLVENRAVAKEMEAAGVVETAELLEYASPVFVIKSITDILDEKTHESKTSNDFVANFKTATNSLCLFVKEIVEKRDVILESISKPSKLGGRNGSLTKRNYLFS